MKYLTITICLLFVIMLVKGLQFISSEENQLSPNTDWGIAKDHPIR